jgi:hypothetical protein
MNPQQVHPRAGAVNPRLLTRRNVLSAGGAIGGTLLLAACGGSNKAPQQGAVTGGGGGATYKGPPRSPSASGTAGPGQTETSPRR